MNILELKNHCIEQINLCKENFDPDIAIIQKGRWGKKGYRKLFGVKGEIVFENMDNTIVVMYPAKDILKYIELLNGV